MYDQNVADISMFESLQAGQHTSSSQMNVFNSVGEVAKVYEQIQLLHDELSDVAKRADKLGALQTNAFVKLKRILDAEAARINNLPEEKKQKEKAAIVAIDSKYKGSFFNFAHIMVNDNFK